MLAWVEAEARQENTAPSEHHEHVMELLLNGERGLPSGGAGLGLGSGGASKNTLLSVRTSMAAQPLDTPREVVPGEQARGWREARAPSSPPSCLWPPSTTLLLLLPS